MANMYNERNIPLGPDQIKIKEENIAKMQDCLQQGFLYTLANSMGGYGIGYFGTQPTNVARRHIMGLLGSFVGYMVTRIYYVRKCLISISQDPSNALHQQYNLQRNMQQNYAADHGNAPSFSESEIINNIDSPMNILDSHDQPYPAVPSFDELPSNIEEYNQEQEKDLTELPLSAPTLSYDDLRKKNREEYMRSYQRAYSNNAAPTPVIRRQPRPEPSAEPQGGARTKYGDVWE